jgi:hypothetical protein
MRRCRTVRWELLGFETCLGGRRNPRLVEAGYNGRGGFRRQWRGDHDDGHPRLGLRASPQLALAARSLLESAPRPAQDRGGEGASQRCARQSLGLA